MKKVLIADDHAVVRNGVKKIFEDQPDETTFGEANTALEVTQLVREENWDLVILDISLGGGRNGLDALKEIRRIRPRLRVLVLTMHAEEQYARRAFKAGAAGYITKDSSRAELLKAVNKVAEGFRYISPAFAEELVVNLERNDRLPEETLSDREFEVMRLIASGKTVGEIAVLLSLSGKTISTYRARILEKMEMRTNAELTHYAIQKHLVE